MDQGGGISYYNGYNYNHFARFYTIVTHCLVRLCHNEFYCVCIQCTMCDFYVIQQSWDVVHWSALTYFLLSGNITILFKTDWKIKK